MRALYREQTYIHGNKATVSLFPVFPLGRKRRGRYKPTSDMQAQLNHWNAKERLGRQLDANMEVGDGFWMLSFTDEKLPQTREEAIRVYQAFKKRLARWFARNEMGELKMATVYHGDVRGPRLHIHTVIHGEIPAATMARLWGQGRVEVSPLYDSPTGWRGLAEYMLKGMEAWARVMTTRNMVDPQPVERTGRISKDEVAEIQENWDNKKAWEGRWPDYEIAEVKPFYNWFNGHYYLRVYLYKRGEGNVV